MLDAIEDFESAYKALAGSKRSDYMILFAFDIAALLSM